MRVRADGKVFSLGGTRFPFRGVTYGTFKPRSEDGARYPARARLGADMAAIAEAGFTVVRTYTEPTADLMQYAGDAGLHVLAGVFYPDWRYLVGASRRQQARLSRDASAAVRSAARQFAGDERILGLTLGNEIPADVIRWVGTGRIASAISRLVDIVHDEDPDQLVTYANYPTAEYLPLDDLDFVTFNVFLEQQPDFRRYLTRLHHLAGDRPLVLGEVGLDAGTDAEGEARQAEVLDWQLATAMERGVAGTCIFSWTDEWWVGDQAVHGWHFGLTSADRRGRPSLEVARTWNRRSVADLSQEWPSISVVICAYNAAATLDECLIHATAMDYPDIELIVVDDGSTDETAAIAAHYPSVRLVEIPHSGLSAARNEGTRAATGDLVAFLDSDAYPPADWPYYLALGMDGRLVGGVGGPNVPPRHDPVEAQQVARAPGGPVHVLMTDDRAEHIPGCNMAFWKVVLNEVGGFDPIYTAAGDDVDLCWKVLDRGWEIGFHPAALVWHHRRSGLRPYLRQQRGYGRAEALVEARHPDRFTSAGSARWRGRIYDSFPPKLLRQRVYRGMYGTAAFQSVYRAGGYTIDLLHQVGVPILAALLLTAPLGLRNPLLAVPAAVAAILLTALFSVDVLRVRPPRRVASPTRFRFGVATMTMLQPLVRTWGRFRHRHLARRDLDVPKGLQGPLHRPSRDTLLLPETQPRADTAVAIVHQLRRAGLRILPATGWEAHDARIIASTVVRGDLVTTSHPVGWVQLRVRRSLRVGPFAVEAALASAVAVMHPWLGAAVGVAIVLELARGWRRTGAVVRRAVGSLIADEQPAQVDYPRTAKIIDLRTASERAAETNAVVVRASR